MDWMDANQLGRRNLSKEAHDLLLGRRYNRTKKAITNPSGIGGKSGKIDEDQNELQQSTAAKLATEHGVSEATVKRAGQFAEAVEAQGLEAEAMSGKLKGKKKEVVEAHRKATSETKEGEDAETLVVDGNQHASKSKSSMETFDSSVPIITIERAAELSGSTTASIKRAKPIVTTGIPELQDILHLHLHLHLHLDGIDGIDGIDGSTRSTRSTGRTSTGRRNRGICPREKFADRWGITRTKSPGNLLTLCSHF